MDDFLVNCPKCGKPGVVNDTCPACGVVASSYLKMLKRKEKEAEEAKNPPVEQASPQIEQTPFPQPPEEDKKSGMPVGALVVVGVVLVALVGGGYYFIHSEQKRAESLVAAPVKAGSADKTAPTEASKPEAEAEGPKLGLMDRIKKWFSGELNPNAPAKSAAKSTSVPVKYAQPTNVTSISDAEFDGEVLKSTQPVVVMFWADGNPPSKRVAPEFDKMSIELASKIKFVKMNVLQSRNTIDTYQINAYPTLLMFENGSVTKKQVGGGSPALIREALGLPGPAQTDESARTASINLINSTDQDFDNDVLKANGPVLVEFWASWCPSCRESEPEVKKLAEQVDGKVKVVKVNIDDCQLITFRYSVPAVPAFYLFENGEVKKKSFGGGSVDEIKNNIGI